jgi:hypothetical protein
VSGALDFTNAFGISLACSSGMPIRAASAIAGWVSSTPSSSAGRGFDESVELLLALRGERDPDDALAIGVGGCGDQAVCVGAVDEPDRAVVARTR